MLFFVGILMSFLRNVKHIDKVPLNIHSTIEFQSTSNADYIHLVFKLGKKNLNLYSKITNGIKNLSDSIKNRINRKGNSDVSNNLYTVGRPS